MKNPAAILRYHGGKHKIADWIVGQMPPHSCYVEPFGGGASVLIRKAPAKTEVYNDLDKEVYNVFRTIRENVEALSAALSLTPYSREELYLACEPTTDLVESARRFLVRSHLSVSTTSKGKSGFRAAINSDDHCSQVRTFHNLPELVMRIRERFASVVLENCDAFSLFDRYDLPKTLWYLDPPYTYDTRSKKSIMDGYNYNLSDEQHRQLCARITQLKGFVMLSGYDNELYNDCLPGWHKTARKGFTDSTTKQVQEVLWMNFQYQNLFSKQYSS